VVNVAVWLCDGNIRYLHGKHIALFLVALFTLLLCLLPYTLLLTVGQWLHANFSQRWFHWINKPRIKPFLDAYQAPYRDQHRYWTGLLLCLRCALFLVFACNIQADPSINLLAISSVAIGLTVVTRYTGAVYRKLYVDFLETSFVVNLGILAIATYYVKLAVVPVNQAAVVYTSVQWRRKIVEFRGAEARRHAVLPCFSPANIEFIINLQRIHPTILCYCLGCTQIHFHQTQTNYQLLQSYTCWLV